MTFKSKDILAGLLGGIVGGMAVDLIFIGLAGPSAIFSIIGITERSDVFLSHAVLGGILGILFAMILRKLPRLNIWFAGVFFGLLCLLFVGAIPSFLAHYAFSATVVIFGFVVWIIFGFTLVAAIKISRS